MKRQHIPQTKPLSISRCIKRYLYHYKCNVELLCRIHNSNTIIVHRLLRPRQFPDAPFKLRALDSTSDSLKHDKHERARERTGQQAPDGTRRRPRRPLKVHRHLGRDERRDHRHRLAHRDTRDLELAYRLAHLLHVEPLHFAPHALHDRRVHARGELRVLLLRVAAEVLKRLADIEQELVYRLSARRDHVPLHVEELVDPLDGVVRRLFDELDVARDAVRQSLHRLAALWVVREEQVAHVSHDKDSKYLESISAIRVQKYASGRVEQRHAHLIPEAVEG
jgi:hypothetical protein